MIDDLDLDGDTLREECGVFGIFGHPDAAALTALGLHALQHRGQEAAGIVSYDGERFHTERRMGLVGDHFSSDKIINRLKGTQAREKPSIVQQVEKIPAHEAQPPRQPPRDLGIAHVTMDGRPVGRGEPPQR